MPLHEPLKNFKVSHYKAVPSSEAFQISVTAFTPIVSEIYLRDNEPIYSQQCKIPSLHFDVTGIQLKV